MTKLEQLSHSKPLLIHKVDGHRFQFHGVPHEILEDFSRTTRVIIEIAEHLYRVDHGRLPEHIREKTTIQTFGIEKGSAIFTHEIVRFHNELLPSPFEGYLEKAKNLLINIFKNNYSHFLDLELPTSVINLVKNIGKDLRKDEFFEFSEKHSPNKKTTYSPKTRTKLVSTLDNLKKQVDRKLIVKMVSWNFETGAVEFRILNGKKLKSEPDLRFDEKLNLLQDRKEEKWARIHCSIEQYNDDDINIRHIYDLTILDFNNFHANIKEILSLQDGWYNGEGFAPSIDGVIWFQKTFSDYPPELPKPYVYPTINGELQLEWSFENYEISLRINLENHEGELSEYNITSESISYYSFDLNNPTSIPNIIKKLYEYASSK